MLLYFVIQNHHTIQYNMLYWFKIHSTGPEIIIPEEIILFYSEFAWDHERD